MKATEGKLGRVFMLRLEEGDMIPDCIEKFAMDNNISTAHVSMLGTLMEGEIIVGPRKTSENPPRPMDLPIYEAHETIATGVIAPDKDEKPILHIHGALGRSGGTIMGCLRNGVKSWICCEVIVQEILGVHAKRLRDEKTGFTLLNLG
ncbi:DNA-binding protein [Wukongibacter baidiensis]|uniref:PPC domain-containing DNA-binding protein n=1 Tax=Wukongibacter baidiensis TaxID=1723361 RepID=UPI003D7FF25E